MAKYLQAPGTREGLSFSSAHILRPTPVWIITVDAFIETSYAPSLNVGIRSICATTTTWGRSCDYPLYRWRTWSTWDLRTVPKVTQLRNGTPGSNPGGLALEPTLPQLCCTPLTDLQVKGKPYICRRQEAPYPPISLSSYTHCSTKDPAHSGDLAFWV